MSWSPNTCVDCGTQISWKNNPKRCRSCAQRDRIARHGCPGKGNIVRVDTELLSRRILRHADSLNAFGHECGIADRNIFRVLKRGTCSIDTIDKMACALGCHYTEFEVSA